MLTMQYLKILLFPTTLSCLITYYTHAQANKQPVKSIISTKTVVLNFEKQTDTLKIPVVSDKYPALQRALSDKNIFDGDDLSDVVNNYKSCGCGITSMYYYVTYEDSDILSIVMYFETINAYPDGHQKYLTYNIHTGELYPLTKEIDAEGLDWIYNYYQSTMKKRIGEGKDNADEPQDEVYRELKTAVDGLKTGELFENYVFAKDCILFTTDNILPHADQANEPDHNLSIPLKKLRPYKTAMAIVLK